MIPKFLCTNTAQKTLIVFALFIFSSSAFSQSAFATIWRTTSSGESITIPTFTGETYDYTVDWGDGSSSDTNVMGDVTHNYAVSGDYLIIITGLFPRIYFNCEGDKLKIISIEEWGANPWTSMNSAFVCCENLVINAGDAPNLSGVTDLGIMFTGAIYFDGDLSSWDVSKVTNMDHMFADARAFHGGLGSWDVSSVIDMSGMFLGATAFNDDLSWDISNVLYMTDMFADVTLSTTNYDNTLMVGAL